MKSVTNLSSNNVEASAGSNNSSRVVTPSTSKNSSKKLNLTKTKLKKSSGQHSSPTNQSHNAGSSSSGSVESTSFSNREKSHHKSYAGLNAKSIKCIWEQHDQSDTEVSSEVFVRLAEDATYKLWELANNLKTYARHSGGKVTADLVNEVLRDSDVPPCIGAGNTTWDKIDYDGTYFFHFDEVHELRDEYLRDVQLTQTGPTQLSTNWWTKKDSEEELIKLSNHMSCAILTGNETAFNYAVHTARINPYMGSIIKPLFVKCLEILVPEYTNETLERCIKFMSAAIYNYHTRDSYLDDIFIHLAQILSCILLGPSDTPLNEIKQIKKTEKNEIGMLKTQSNEKMNFDLPKDTSLNIKLESIPMHVSMDIDVGRNDYSDLYPLMADDSFGIKIEPSETFNEYQTEQELMDIKTKSELPSLESIVNDNQIKDEKINISLDDIKKEELFFEENDNEITENEDQPQQSFSILKTIMCTSKYVDDICYLIGYAAGKWGYFESEIIYLLSKRLEIHFQCIDKNTAIDYAWLSRAIRCLLCLGDYATRELIPYCSKMDPFLIPEWLNCYFNPIGQFLRGKSDIFFYEYLNEVCGDGLNPFMIYYSKYLDKIAKKRLRKKYKHDTYKIKSKLFLKSLTKKESTTNTLAWNKNNIFPDYANIKSRKIGFKFAGCCPVIVKTKKRQQDNQLIQDKDELSVFNGKIVIGKRKLLRSVTNIKTDTILYDFRGLKL